MRGCKRCQCGSDGKWECEKRHCGPPQVACTVGDSFTQDHKVWECVAGARWQITQQSRNADGGGDNACRAGQTKTAGCAPCSCVDGQWQCPESSSCAPAPACVPGDRVEVQCNTCRCSATKTWDCSNRVCPQQATLCAEDDTKSAGDGCNLVCATGCTLGDTKQHRCNNCTCLANGSWNCTAGNCGPCFGHSCPAGLTARVNLQRLCFAGEPCAPCDCV
jgi:hypothetical protein